MSEAAHEAATPVGDEATDQVEQPAPKTLEEIPADILSDLDGPDLDDDDEDEVDTTPYGEEEIGDEYVDPEQAAKLAKRAAKAEKKAAFYQDRLVKSERKKWVAEAEKFFPYADPDSIQATSRRAFRREAAAQHNALKARVDAGMERERKQLAEREAQLEQGERDATRTAWGQPPSEDAARAAAERQKQVYTELATRSNFDKSVKARMADPDDPVSKAFAGMLKGIETRD